jgi:hypothetical protein
MPQILADVSVVTQKIYIITCKHEWLDCPVVVFNHLFDAQASKIYSYLTHYFRMIVRNVTPLNSTEENWNYNFSAFCFWHTPIHNGIKVCSDAAGRVGCSLLDFYQIPEGSNLIHSRKYVKSHKIFYVFRHSPVFVREIYSKVYLTIWAFIMN